MAVRVRRAVEADLEALVRLEKVFPGDRFDARHIRGQLGRAGATVLVLDDGGEVVGSAFLLWPRRRDTAHLYSIAVDAGRQGRGLGHLLLRAAERAAVRRGYGRMMLEVREDNTGARRFYEARDYVAAGRLAGFYDDGAPGVRMVKSLAEDPPPSLRWNVPYYGQTLEFTCGPACLMMAMKHADPALALTRSLELALWKEATLIFMTSGLGGCGPMGLAVAARRRGFAVETVSGDRRVPFLSSVRTRDKKEVMTLVHQDQRREALALGVEVDTFPFTFATLTEGMRRGLVPVVLVSTYRLHGKRAPHWVVVTGFDEERVWFHDPYQGFYVHDRRRGRNLSMSRGEFMHMTAFGRDLYRSVVLVGPREGEKERVRPESCRRMNVA